MRRVLAVDPPYCRCTECIIGEYISLDAAEERHIVDMLRGRTQNNTGHDMVINVEYTVEDGYDFNLGEPETAKVRVCDGDSKFEKEWDITSWWREVAAEERG